MLNPDRQARTGREADTSANLSSSLLDLPPSEFRAAWLAELCRNVDGIRAGFAAFKLESGQVEEFSWPAELRDTLQLKRAAERANADRREVVLWTRSEMAAKTSEMLGIIIARPLVGAEAPYGSVAVAMAPNAAMDVASVIRRLDWGLGWIEVVAARAQAAEARDGAKRVATALDVALTVGEHKRSQYALMALANDLCSRLESDRVSLGACRRGGVRLRALSHHGAAVKSSDLRDTIENAMDEAIDQSAAAVHPALAGTTRRLSVAQRALAKSGGASCVLSVPIAYRRRAIGAMTLERVRDEPFDTPTVRLVEMAATLIAPILGLQIANDRWISGRSRDLTGQSLRAVFGSGHVAAKLIVLAAIGLAAWLAVAEGAYRVTAKASMEGSVQRAAPAPFDGYISSAPKRAGDIVRKGELLASLDDKDLLLEKVKLQGDLGKEQQTYHEAFAKSDRPAVASSRAQIDQARAQLAVVEAKLARTRIVAPFDGIVVSGDFSQLLGSPIEKGKTLFEIAPLSDYRVILRIDERDLRSLAVGQSGHLLLAGLPGVPIPMTVSKITPVAAVEDGRNVFRVEAALSRTALPLRPGMEGVAKVDISRRSLAWIWTHSLYDWLRLTAWKWLP